MSGRAYPSKFIGDILTSGGIRPNTEKMSAMVNMPRPQCKKDVSISKGNRNGE